jgi:hypothetical protein
MFVTWHVYRSRDRGLRQRSAAYYDGTPRLKASLVRSERVVVVEGKGKEPRQEHLCYLGSMRADGGDRERFLWHVAERLIDEQLKLKRAERKRIGDAIIGKVGGAMPSKHAVAMMRMRHQAQLRRIAKLWEQRPVPGL